MVEETQAETAVKPKGRSIFGMLLKGAVILTAIVGGANYAYNQFYEARTTGYVVKFDEASQKWDESEWDVARKSGKKQGLAFPEQGEVLFKDDRGCWNLVGVSHESNRETGYMEENVYMEVMRGPYVMHITDKRADGLTHNDIGLLLTYSRSVEEQADCMFKRAQLSYEDTLEGQFQCDGQGNPNYGYTGSGVQYHKDCVPPEKRTEDQVTLAEWGGNDGAAFRRNYSYVMGKLADRLRRVEARVKIQHKQDEETRASDERKKQEEQREADLARERATRTHLREFALPKGR